MSDTKEHKVNRSNFARGPWDDEPDRIEWRTAAGLPGLIVRNRAGALCGYAAVSPGHPLHGKDDSEPDVSVHGGLTYADACQGSICHVPAPGEPDDVWWFGFDCAHCGDLIPIDADPRYFSGATYRNTAYVRREVESLAAQLVAIATP